MKLCNIHIKNLIIPSVSDICKGFKNWQKVAEICYQLVHYRASKGLALFLIWRDRLIYMALTLCEHACKTVFDVKPRIDPCPSPARSWDKAYQISGCTAARKKKSDVAKKVKLLLGTASSLHFCKNNIWGWVHFNESTTFPAFLLFCNYSNTYTYMIHHMTMTAYFDERN